MLMFVVSEVYKRRFIWGLYLRYFFSFYAKLGERQPAKVGIYKHPDGRMGLVISFKAKENAQNWEHITD